MSYPDLIEKLKTGLELVICDSERSRHAHKELFRLDDGSYIVIGEESNSFEVIEEILQTCNSLSGACPPKIHFTLHWENLLKVSLWQAARPKAGDVLTLLRNAGVTSDEMQPFRTSDINDLFPYLFYGKRFDILRGICHSARKQTEGRIKYHAMRVVCHLVSADTNAIVSSSL